MAGFKRPDGAEEHLFKFEKQDYMEIAEEIAHDPLGKTLLHIAFGRDPSRTTSPVHRELPRVPGLRGFVPGERLGHVTHMNIYGNGSTGADKFCHYVRKRTVGEWFNRFFRASAELLEEAHGWGIRECEQGWPQHHRYPVVRRHREQLLGQHESVTQLRALFSLHERRCRQ